MTRRFFSRNGLWGFPNALIVLMCVFFLVPFALRGAKDALQRMENNVADWLPSSFDETAQLRWFREHFMGEQFIVMTWDGCQENDPRYAQFIERLRREVEPNPDSPSRPEGAEEEAPNEESRSVSN